ncbi:transcriptional regulator [Longimycelium tulufanense]|uniref:Transcriptional regulator n=1 Tax=Longimycelium tulufanense TaxID=907463 RepID=A0A8J3C5G4_9PSEU|nr:helix-turn-helix transcriptional regulator [Longimycelium tulufanense]GGM32759.1 transcriptional regulator [Longimycelium tulufanense]
MTETDPLWLRRQVGRELRMFRTSMRARTGREVTTTDAAAELGCTQPKISQMEAGRYKLNWRDVRDLLKFYAAPEKDITRLVEWTKRAEGAPWWDAYRSVVHLSYADLVGGESEAVRAINYDFGVVPGLLQHQEYAQVLTNKSRAVPPTHREAILQLRMNRQRRLTETTPLELIAVIEESVLHRPVGSPSVMRKQLDHLLVMNDLPNVTVQVIQTAAGFHSALSGRFALLEFAEFTPAVYLEHGPTNGSRYSHDPALVEVYTEIAAEIRAKALNPDESGKLISAARNDLAREG